MGQIKKISSLLIIASLFVGCGGWTPKSDEERQHYKELENAYQTCRDKGNQISNKYVRKNYYRTLVFTYGKYAKASNWLESCEKQIEVFVLRDLRISKFNSNYTYNGDPNTYNTEYNRRLAEQYKNAYNPDAKTPQELAREKQQQINNNLKHLDRQMTKEGLEDYELAYLQAQRLKVEQQQAIVNLDSDRADELSKLMRKQKTEAMYLQRKYQEKTAYNELVEANNRLEQATTAEDKLQAEKDMGIYVRKYDRAKKNADNTLNGLNNDYENIDNFTSSGDE